MFAILVCWTEFWDNKNVYEFRLADGEDKGEDCNWWDDLFPDERGGKDEEVKWSEAEEVPKAFGNFTEDLKEAGVWRFWSSLCTVQWKMY